MMRESQEFDPIVVEAIKRIRGGSHLPHPDLQLIYRHVASRKYRIIALTNNYAVMGDGAAREELEFLGWHEGATPPRLRTLFDDFCDSSTLGMRYGLQCALHKCWVLSVQQETGTRVLSHRVQEEWYTARGSHFPGRSGHASSSRSVCPVADVGDAVT